MSDRSEAVRVVAVNVGHRGEDQEPGDYEVASVAAWIGGALPQSEWVEVAARDADALDAALSEAGIDFEKAPTAFRYRRRRELR